MRKSLSLSMSQIACAAIGCASALLSVGLYAGESLQPGFYYHEPDSVALRLSDARSGLVCRAEGEPAAVCEKAIKIVITGDETCDWSPGTRYPCTRFGYEFSYQGADPGTAMQCEALRSDPTGRRESHRYEHPLEFAKGKVFHATFRTYAPVDERIILSEVHECSYQGALVSTIEYIIYYEPGSSATADRPALEEIPHACESPFLTLAVARNLLDAEAKRIAASERVPTLVSQCLYSARGASAREVGLVLKFMLSDMFGVENVSHQQLRFNATFAAGGARLEQVIDALGDKAFVFEKDDRTTLLVITGVAGRDDPVGRATELVATYYLDRPEMDAATRLARLSSIAEEHVRWLHER